MPSWWELAWTVVRTSAILERHKHQIPNQVVAMPCVLLAKHMHVDVHAQCGDVLKRVGYSRMPCGRRSLRTDRTPASPPVLE